MRIAYLCNLYPAVSHSFVRREIEAVESAGHIVSRFSLRPAKSDLKDEADLREANLTEPVLAAGILRLIVATLRLFVTRPLRSMSAVSAAYRLSGPGLKSKLRHVIYFIESAWLTQRLEQLGIEHLHAHFGTNPAAVAAIVRAWGGPTFSFTVHGPDEFDSPIGLSLAEKIQSAHFVASISNYGRSQLMRWSRPEDWSKIKVIRCGLDAGFLQAPHQQVPGDSTEFVCVARLSAQKGLALLIAACDTLRARGERFTVTIIGDGELRSSLEANIRKRRLDDVVSLVGICAPAEIIEHLARARTFVLPSFAEGLPVVLMEALALHRPVITTWVAGIPELVDADCGWLIPAGSEAALVNAMESSLRASPEDLAAKGARGSERVKRMHDVQQNAALIIQAINGSARSLVLD